MRLSAEVGEQEIWSFGCANLLFDHYSMSESESDSGANLALSLFVPSVADAALQCLWLEFITC